MGADEGKVHAQRETGSRAEDLTRKTRVRRRLLICLLYALCGPLVAEGSTRFLLFGEGQLASEWGSQLRNPLDYASAVLEDEYWLLKWSQEDADENPVMHTFDPLCGWVGHRIAPLTYILRDFVEDDSRHLLLLYGASYASSITPNGGSFRHLLAESSLERSHYLINYGVGGFGLGQTYLLMRETIDQHAGQEQTVVIALVADSDFERCFLGFGTAPKPQFIVEAGRLLDPAPVIDTQGSI